MILTMVYKNRQDCCHGKRQSSWIPSRNKFSGIGSISNGPKHSRIFRLLHLMTEANILSGKLHLSNIDNVRHNTHIYFDLVAAGSWNNLNKSFLVLRATAPEWMRSLREGSSSPKAVTEWNVRQRKPSTRGRIWFSVILLIRILKTSVVRLNTCRLRRRR
jgi:hypothetical protein